jgi:hypothetical protein
MTGQFTRQHSLEASVIPSDEARESVARRVIAHPNGGADMLDALGLGDLG